MINNYLDSFENYLTVENHKEIREELEASLLDQIEEKEEQLSRPLNKQEQEELLLKLGHPMKVAAGFLPNQQLVSAEYFPAYKKVLIIALWIYGIITVLRIRLLYYFANCHYFELSRNQHLGVCLGDDGFLFVSKILGEYRFLIRLVA